MTFEFSRDKRDQDLKAQFDLNYVPKVTTLPFKLTPSDFFFQWSFFEKNLIFEKRDLEISTDPSMKQEKE